ncbi:hypothetical protein HanRHA438_Chr16g0746021 [Helianthus annuus]|nr:hypothetical protein HanRHA438_Chr16g0746021 [Helianthus annuus]
MPPTQTPPYPTVLDEQWRVKIHNFKRPTPHFSEEILDLGQWMSLGFLPSPSCKCRHIHTMCVFFKLKCRELLRFSHLTILVP